MARNKDIIENKVLVWCNKMKTYINIRNNTGKKKKVL